MNPRQQRMRKPSLVNTVKGNSVPYSKQQQHDALKAQQLMESMGCPTIADLNAMVQANQIKNNPITLQDIEVMEAIYGPHVPSIKGKMTRSKPPIVKEDYVAIPQELLDAQEQVTLRGQYAREWRTVPHFNRR